MKIDELYIYNLKGGDFLIFETMYSSDAETG